MLHKLISKIHKELIKRIVAIGLISVSVLFVLIEIKEFIKVQLPYSIYFFIIPIVIAVFLRVFCLQKAPRGITEIYFGCWLSAVEYLLLLILGINVSDYKVKMIVYVI